MRLKPIISNETRIESNSSLLFSFNKGIYTKLAADGESKTYLKEKGRLLMLPILYKERSLEANKNIHNMNLNHNHWSRCTCEFAFRIRCNDLFGRVENKFRRIV